MKTNKLISIALVTLMAVTVVSGAGMMTEQAFAWGNGFPPTSAAIANSLTCSDLGWSFAMDGQGGDIYPFGW